MYTIPLLPQAGQQQQQQTPNVPTQQLADPDANRQQLANNLLQQQQNHFIHQHMAAYNGRNLFKSIVEGGSEQWAAFRQLSINQMIQKIIWLNVWMHVGPITPAENALAGIVLTELNRIRQLKISKDKINFQNSVQLNILMGLVGAAAGYIGYNICIQRPNKEILVGELLMFLGGFTLLSVARLIKIGKDKFYKDERKPLKQQ